jgi:murein DD-endopeptidase MepM/ murein hydrolase activator NlpD
VRADARDGNDTLATTVTARTKAALVVALAAAVAVPVVAAGGDSARGAANATAHAEAFKRSGSTGQSGHVTVDGNGSRTGEGTRVSASTARGKGTAEASASLGAVNIFSGLVTASAVRVEASATSAGTTVDGAVEGLAIDGKPHGAVTSAGSYDLGGYGTLEVLSRDGTSITALRATLSRDYKSHPAGSSQSFAFARATATDGAPAGAQDTEDGEPKRTRQAKSPAPAPERRRRRPSREPEGAAGDAEEGAVVDEPAERRRAPSLDALPTDRGYLFPVHGDSGYTDDWGAPRAHTGTHEGTDIYAATGTPVLAVTDGTLYRVGTRQIPGNRMWLRSSNGDTFFFAHLSAFAHDARNGAKVRAGDVIGFVGSTGDAEQTPPHLHFEIHPQDGEAVNPYPFLRAWESRRDVPHAAWLARYGNDPGSRPGALVVLRDFLER